MRYVCIHGHFYQPPRDNPWLEAIEVQDSAYPFHDWNERITSECYAPNGASRILDGEGRIVRIVNNYARISFNVGPTLLSWMQEKAPDVYGFILQADKDSQERFSGHGSAMAQAYHHMIMPLAHPEDRITQVVWGIRDFEYRFGRFPEGMWLPETAVDVPTLEVLAQHGIRFTVLAPHQAQRVRPIGDTVWRDVSGGRIDPTMPYRIVLPSGRHMALFFYDGPISKAVAFEGLLSNGEHFARRLMEGFVEGIGRPQLVHIATDGETYGHHHRHGDMALAYALHYLEQDSRVQVTNYGEFLERFPPTHEVDIVENSSWSCAHGIERWRSDCGCHAGVQSGWRQTWREPLRSAFDWLRQELNDRWVSRVETYVHDAWEARNAYIDVVLDRSPARFDAFLSRIGRRPLTDGERVDLLKLLEMQRHLMQMYTSCGWFFDEVSGIETVQVMQYAGRALQLGEELFGISLESAFLERLEKVPSNIPGHGNGARIYERFVKPAKLDLRKVGAHYAISSMFETYTDRTHIECYDIRRHDLRTYHQGGTRLAVGRIDVTSRLTGETADLGYAVIHFGEYNVNGGVREFAHDDQYEAAAEATAAAFQGGDFPEVIRLLDHHFGTPVFSLKSLFRDEQRRVVDRILEATLQDLEAGYGDVYRRHEPLMNFLRDLRIPLPEALLTAAQYVLNAQLLRAFRQVPPDLDELCRLLKEARRWQVPLDEGVAFALGKGMEAMMARLRGAPDNLTLLAQMTEMSDLLEVVPFEVNLWQVQNDFYAMLHTYYPIARRRAEAGDEEARGWVLHFRALGEKLAVKVDA